MRELIFLCVIIAIGFSPCLILRDSNPVAIEKTEILQAVPLPNLYKQNKLELEKDLPNPTPVYSGISAPQDFVYIPVNRVGGIANKNDLEANNYRLMAINCKYNNWPQAHFKFQ